MNGINKKIGELQQQVNQMSQEVKNCSNLLQELIHLLGPAFPRETSNVSSNEISTSSTKGNFIYLV
jgi:hypothetical protein